jgi:ribosomal protein S12 methylthiotransferase accessory factor YcaO
MLLADVLLTLIHHSHGIDESTKWALSDAVLEAYKGDIDALSDDDKELRPAPIDHGAATAATSIVVTKAAFDAAVAKFVADANAKASAEAAKQAKDAAA